jgi:RNA polymerase sigma-70 factor (ECF subfamily)
MEPAHSRFLSTKSDASRPPGFLQIAARGYIVGGAFGGDGHSMHTTPVTLLERLRDVSDVRAWERLLELYCPLLYFWALRAGETEDDAADLVQDVLLLLVKALPSFRYDANKSFRGWLRTLTLNKLRERKRKQRVVASLPLDDVAEPKVPDPAERFWDDEYRRQLLGRALTLMQSDFEPTTWQACWQSVAEDRSAADIARDLGISENAVYLARCRVLRRVRQELNHLLN